MASTSPPQSTSASNSGEFVKLPSEIVNELTKFVWGSSELREDVFSRWSQGFEFSKSIPSALVQFQGGPCAILAPVQAFIIKAALFFSGGSPDISALKTATNEQVNNFLLEAIYEIMKDISIDDFVMVKLDQQSCLGLQEEECKPSEHPEDAEPDALAMDLDTDKKDQGTANHDKFHSNLLMKRCPSTELKKTLLQELPFLKSQFGILLFLYSVLLTKGIDQIKNEVEDPSEPLIDGTYGHGSQSLINLLITSDATSNVWDNDKDISGLKLRGVSRQSIIGFLTILEQMRYCEVGWFLKNPKYPIWILGSETHLTVLFSTVENLVVRDTPAMNAKQVFAQFDPEGNGFIATQLLEDVLRSLDLVAEREYVDIMASKLDSEGLGIITQSAFMEEFFPEQPSEFSQSFPLYHYNGLQQSFIDGKTSFSECKAVLAEEIDTQFITDTSPIKLCLQTKWPSIELQWENNISPSLN